MIYISKQGHEHVMSKPKVSNRKTLTVIVDDLLLKSNWTEDILNALFRAGRDQIKLVEYSHVYKGHSDGKARVSFNVWIYEGLEYVKSPNRIMYDAELFISLVPGYSVDFEKRSHAGAKSKPGNHITQSVNIGNSEYSKTRHSLSKEHGKLYKCSKCKSPKHVSKYGFAQCWQVECRKCGKIIDSGTD